MAELINCFSLKYVCVCVVFLSLLTPWSSVLLENLTGFQLLKILPAFFGNRKFITAVTSVRHLSLSWASSIRFTHPHPTSWKSILILSSHLRLGISSVLFPQASPPTPCTLLYPHPYAPHALPISFVSILPPAQYWVRSTDHSAPRYAAFSIPPSPRPSCCLCVPNVLYVRYAAALALSNPLIAARAKLLLCSCWHRAKAVLTEWPSFGGRSATHTNSVARRTSHFIHRVHARSVIGDVLPEGSVILGPATHSHVTGSVSRSWLECLRVSLRKLLLFPPTTRRELGF